MSALSEGYIKYVYRNDNGEIEIREADEWYYSEVLMLEPDFKNHVEMEQFIPYD